MFAEFNKYFEEGLKSTECLKLFPSIKNIYLRYNTDLPSSALVERLFSFAKDVLQNKRSKLTDIHFEQQLLLKYNSKLLSII